MVATHNIDDNNTITAPFSASPLNLTAKSVVLVADGMLIKKNSVYLMIGLIGKNATISITTKDITTSFSSEDIYACLLSNNCLNLTLASFIPITNIDNGVTALPIRFTLSISLVIIWSKTELSCAMLISGTFAIINTAKPNITAIIVGLSKIFLIEIFFLSLVIM